MNTCARIVDRCVAAAVAVAALCLAGTARAVTTTTLDVDFEAPTFSLGDVTTSPAAVGQGGWGGWNAAVVNGSVVWPQITDAQAHSGRQSMLTRASNAVIAHLLDENSQVGNQEFVINAAGKWWVQAWVYLNPGASVEMVMFNGLGGCPLIQIAGNGVPYLNTCLSHRPSEPSLGDGAHGQWLLLQMVHSDTTTQDIEFSITGQGIAYSNVVSGYSGPGSGQPNYLGLRGDAYWDDVKAGYGDVPLAPVPEPAIWLLGLLGLPGVLLVALRRRGRGRQVPWAPTP